MKKAICLHLALLMVLSLAACGEGASSGATASAGGSASSLSEVSAGESSVDPITPPAVTDDVVTASTKDTGDTTVFEMEWNRTRHTLMMTEITHTDAESAQQAEISGAYDRRSVSLYSNVTVTEGADGTQVLSGEKIAIKDLFVGDGAEDCIRQTRNWRENQIDQGMYISLNRLYIRLLDGESLTGEDMERVTRECDAAITLTLRGSGEDAEIVEFTESFIDYDDTDTSRKIVRKLQDGVLRVGEEYRNDAIVYRQEMRADRTLEKFTQYYSNGNISRVAEYDENGEMIRETKYDEDGDPIEE